MSGGRSRSSGGCSARGMSPAGDGMGLGAGAVLSSKMGSVSGRGVAVGVTKMPLGMVGMDGSHESAQRGSARVQMRKRTSARLSRALPVTKPALSSTLPPSGGVSPKLATIHLLVVQFVVEEAR